MAKSFEELLIVYIESMFFYAINGKKIYISNLKCIAL